MNASDTATSGHKAIRIADAFSPCKFDSEVFIGTYNRQVKALVKSTVMRLFSNNSTMLSPGNNFNLLGLT
jgi:hypothetical protein